MATPEPVVNPVTNLPTNVLSCMPSPRGKNSLHFQGKDIKSFLTEYEHFATHANLTDEMRCEEIRIYFSKREKWVLDILDGYTSGNWEDLKRELKSLYTSSAERKIYQPQDIQHFIAKKRKVSKLVHFNTYHCQFRVIMRGLEAQNALSEYD